MYTKGIEIFKPINYTKFYEISRSIGENKDDIEYDISLLKKQLEVYFKTYIKNITIRKWWYTSIYNI